MSLRHNSWIIAAVIALTAAGVCVAQEAPPGAGQTAGGTTYLDLRNSNDRVTRLTAERYFNLVKTQEWSDITGKSKVSAKYLEHDPDLKWVKLEAVRVRGGKREAKEITVSVEKLSKTCRSRVRQINALQARLAELAAAEDEEGAADAADGQQLADPGSPMIDERGVEPPGRDPRGERFAAAEFPPAASSPTEPAAEEFEEDPLGFAEVPLEPLPQGPPGGLPIPGMPLTPAAGPPAEGNVDPKQWATSYAAFQANFTAAPDEQGAPKLAWGELDELRTIGESIADQGRDGRGENTTVPAERLAQVRWQGAFQGFLPSRAGGMRVAFDLPPLPPPLELEFRLDEKQSAPDDWNQVSANAGNRFSFAGRLAMAGPTSIVVYVSDPQPAAGPPQR